VRELNEPWSPTALHRETIDYAERLESLASDLSRKGVAQFGIEIEHNRPLDQEIDVDGWPIEIEDWRISFSGTLFRMKELAASARSAAASLPTARQRRALPFAALGLLHLRYRDERDWAPSLSNNSEAVLELSRICDLAGIPKAPETLRNALSDAMKAFDKHFLPPELRFVILGRWG